MNAHTLQMEICDGGVYLKIQCGYDEHDTTRPCWPYSEGGDDGLIPDPAPQECCTWTQWADELAADELHKGDWVLEDVPFEWDWDGWDSPNLRLLPVAVRPAVPA